MGTHHGRFASNGTINGKITLQDIPARRSAFSYLHRFKLDTAFHTTSVRIILDFFRYLQDEHEIKLYAYVILENHLHCILQADDLVKRIHSFKSYTARRLVEMLEEHGARKLLGQLAFFKKAYKNDRKHQVWEEGTHPELIHNKAMLVQKIQYIHQNPVKRGYVDLPEHWRYSSARNYSGEPGLVEVYQDW